ncbi:restriction endonuclease subunit S [Maribacter sp. MAR_2009_72]|uniref:restriction endonuclease subunit S n=1 Tax=Maribacter sp. MAR_2009_72 TaxID=1250050 RepID=UPI00119C7293|nr:restriction endonuclease subunit S [Maribacter sp. MAR_2009_72]TVZ13954.1 type I restriction enzyme S subunit [Maribacter sp. MAR_2009_72]
MREMLKENLPSDWKYDNIKNIGEVVTGNTPKSNNTEFYCDKGVLWASPADLGKGKYINKTNKQLSKLGFDTTRKLPPLSIMITCIGSTIGKIGMTNSWMSTNQQINSIICNESNFAEFYYYVMGYMAKYIKSLAGTQAVPLLNKSDFSGINVPVPPLPEQQKIAEILSTVDAKIEIINQQIGETQELKKGLMQRLLTKGIGHTEFKDSPLGKIPKSWGNMKLKDECEKLNVGFVGTCEKFYCKKEEGVLMLRTGNLSNGKIKYNNLKYVTTEFHEKNKKSQIFEGDLLVARHGSSGQAVLVPENFEESNCLNIIVIRPIKETLNPQFLKYQFNSAVIKKQVRKKTAGSTQGVVNTKEIASLNILLPAYSEQNKIAAILNSVDGKLNILTEKKNNYQELKTGLMQQLLTGKVRVKLTAEV